MREPIAAARHGYDVAIAPAALIQRFAQGRDVDVQIVFSDRAPRPQPRHQFILADHGAVRRCEHAQDVECAATEFYRLVIVQKATPLRIQPEAT